MNISPTSSPRNGFAVIAGGARSSRASRRMAASPLRLRPSFETLASQAPQDEVGPMIQHPLQILGILPLSSLSCSLTAARVAEGRALAASRVRLILTARCAGNVR